MGYKVAGLVDQSVSSVFATQMLWNSGSVFEAYWLNVITEKC